MKGTRLVSAALLSLGLPACASSCDRSGTEATPDAATSALWSGDGATERASRCTGPTAHRALAQVTEVGQAVVLGRAVAIGVLLEVDGGRGAHQGVVITDDTLSQLSVKDLGAGVADAPPPRPFVGGADLWVAFHPKPLQDLDAGASADPGAPCSAVSTPCRTACAPCCRESNGSGASGRAAISST